MYESENDPTVLLRAIAEMMAAREMPPDGPRKAASRTITTGSQTIDLGAPCRNVRLWASDGAAPVYFAVNNSPVYTAAASDDFVSVSGTMSYERPIADPGAQFVHFRGTVAGGKFIAQGW